MVRELKLTGRGLPLAPGRPGVASDSPSRLVREQSEILMTPFDLYKPWRLIITVQLVDAEY